MKNKHLYLILRPLWWILQAIIIGIWKIILIFVLLFHFLHIVFKGKKHPWCVEFTQKFTRHLKLWVDYCFWVTDERPEIVEY